MPYPKAYNHPRPRCACGCGELTGRRGAYWSRWRKGHHKRKHARPEAFDARRAKKNEYLFRTYGLELGAYEWLLAQQGGRCAVCRTCEPGTGRAHFCVDHCHATGKVRGLLCHACNAGIGQLNDDPALLRAALAYLEA